MGEEFSLKTVLFAFFISFFLFAGAVHATTFDFNVTVKYQNGTVVPNANVSVENYSMSGTGPSLNNVISVLTSSTGFANFSGTNVLSNSSNEFYNLVIHVNNSTAVAGASPTRNYVTHTSPVLRMWPWQMYRYGITGSTMFVEPAVMLNITVHNGTNVSLGSNPGHLMSRSYDIIDGKYGGNLVYKSASSLGATGNNVSDIIVIPLNQTYIFGVYPNQSAPFNVKYGPDKNYTASVAGCDLNSTRYSAGDLIHCHVNGTVESVNITGMININGLNGSLQNLTGLNYQLESGRVYGSGSFSDIGAFVGGGNDRYYNDTGNFTLILPATELGFTSLMMIFANNSSKSYMGLYNTTLSYGASAIHSLNLTLLPMYGANRKFVISGYDSVNKTFYINTTRFNITKNGSAAQNPFSEFNITYPSGNPNSSTGGHWGASYKWTFFPGSGETIVDIPLMSGSSVNAQVFAGGGSPLRRTLSSTKLNTSPYTNLTLAGGSGFDRRDSGGTEQGFGSNAVTVEVFDYQNASCRVADPVAGCNLFNLSGLTGSNAGNQAMKMMLLGKATIRMTDVSSGSAITYVGVDLMNSGPPPMMFEDSADTDATSGSTFSEVWKYGSDGPDMYEFVFVTLPYNDATLDENSAVTIGIDRLYDTTSGDSWSERWNVNNNTTAQLTNLEHYAAEATAWGYLTNNTTCHNDLTSIISTQPCGLDKTNNKIHLRLPHFSGAAPNLGGTSLGGTSASGGGGGGGFTSTVDISYTSLSDLALGTPDIITMSESGTASFSHLGEFHRVTVDTVSGTHATITIESEPITITLDTALAGASTKDIDVDRNGLNDLRVTLLRISETGKADLKFEVLTERAPAAPAEAPAEEPEDDAAEEPASEPVTSPPEEESVPSSLLWIFGIVLVSAIFLYRKIQKK
ncbi:TPA: hypothetical protein H1008_02955 [archaeon]|nr:hypothetical protein [Candidatus Undinarchaeales archaeon SRR5007147.bin71]